MLNDFVRTPIPITQALLKHEKFDGNILEPCCGDGAISKVLQSLPNKIISSDMIDYGFGQVKNLFDITEMHDNIITNPPFTTQTKINKHLFSITKNKLALLWYVKNLGSVIESKNGVGLKNVHILNKKIPFVEIKLNWLFGWYVWQKGYTGDVVIKRIDY